MRRGLIVVDCQKTFCEGGLLGVPGGNQVCKNIANMLNADDLGYTPMHYDLVVFSRDNHKPHSDNGGHISDTPDFVTSFPPHGIAGTDDAELNPAFAGYFQRHPDALVFYKGWDKPAFSAFEGVDEYNFDIDQYFLARGITDVDICGIAKEFCVAATAADAEKRGYKVTILGELYVAALNK